jgi:integration host factor subunit beta
MNRSDLVIRLSGMSSLSLKQTEELVDHILNLMTQTLSQGSRIEIRGFGSFDLSYRPARKARNPRSGETFEQGAKYFPAFKAGKVLRQSLSVH